MDRRKVSLGVLVGFLFIAVWTFLNIDSVGSKIAGNGFQGIFWYVVTDFRNWVVVLSVLLLPTSTGFFRKLSAGLMIALAADIVSYPRLLSVVPVEGEAIRSSLDWIIVSALPFEYGFSFQLYYLVLPIALMIGAFYLLGFRVFLSSLLR